MTGTAAQARACVLALLLAVLPARALLASPQDFTQVEKGRYLTLAADCASCHTVPGSARTFAGGRAIETPFGNIEAPNITPDAQTGIGAWSDAQFDAALRGGVRPDGSRLYPAMPFTAYTKLAREDVVAIRAYLNTTAAFRSPPVQNALPFPFNIRALMRAWDWLYFTPGEFTPEPRQSAEWNRGAFLVQGPAHCGACHTPKSLLGGDKASAYLQGSQLQGWFAPDITNDARTGLGSWQADDVVAYLRSGHNRVSAATGPMAEAVSLSSSKLTQEDLHAIAVYLKSLPGNPATPAALVASDPRMTAGAAIYRDQCSACHGLDGKGSAQLFPSVAQSSLVRSSDPATLVRLVLRGARSVATDAEPTAPGMPAYGRTLNDAQVAAVLTYLRNSWGGAAPAVSPATVASARTSLATRPD